jgi:hypothetical protein
MFLTVVCGGGRSWRSKLNYECICAERNTAGTHGAVIRPRGTAHRAKSPQQGAVYAGREEFV